MQLCQQGFKLIMVESNVDNVLLNIALGFLDILYYLATNYVAVSALFCLSWLFCMYNSMLSSTKSVVVKIIFRSEPHNSW